MTIIESRPETRNVVGRGLHPIDSAYDDPAAYAGWLEAARPRLAHLTTRQAVS